MKAWHVEGEAAAILFFKRAVELDAQFAMAYARLGTRYQILREVALSDANRLNRLEDAETVLKQAEERKLQSENLLWYRYRLAFMRGDRKETERLIAVAARKPDAENLLLPFAAWAEAYYGRRRSARELWRRSAKSRGYWP